MSAVKPAINTLSALRSGAVMDELAVAIHDACGAVRDLGKAAEVTLTIKVKPYSSKGVKLVEPAYVFEADVATKLPKPDVDATLLFLDDDGNPTSNLTKQKELGLSIAGQQPLTNEGAA